MNGSLGDYIGCACEIKTMENDLLMVGKIRNVIYDDNGQALEIASSDGEELPTAAYGIPVKINIFNSKLGYLGLGAKIYISHSSFWRVNEISPLGENERRGYFRIKIHSHAEVIGPDITNTIRKFKCMITSVSLSGLLLAVDDENCYFREGTELEVLSFRIGDGREIFDFTCAVKRVDDHHTLGKLYGCQYLNMNNKSTDRLCQEIFAKQRQDIQKRRGRL